MPFSETAKIRPYIWPYVKNGKGIDVGCGFDKIHPYCIGIDKYTSAATDMQGDITSMTQFSDQQFDWVFSSHAIEDILNYKKALQEWLRILQNDGYLIIYCPYKMWYPNIGMPDANIDHVHDFTPSVLTDALYELCPTLWIVTSEIRGSKRVNEYHEYSCLIIVKKTRPLSPHFLIDNNHNIGDTLSSSNLCVSLKQKFDCKITIAFDEGMILEGFVDHVGKQSIPYDCIIHQNVYRTEFGEWIRRTTHFSQFTTTIYNQIAKFEQIHLPQDTYQPIEMYYNILDKDIVLNLPEKFICISTQTFEPRMWYAQNWQEIISWLNEKQYKVVLIGKYDITEFEGDIEDFRKQTSIRQAAYIVSKAQMLISIDTCFVHFAEIFKIPTVVLMGPSYDKETFSNRLSNSTTKAVYRNDQGCIGCYNWTSKTNQYEWINDTTFTLPKGDKYITGNELPLYVLENCKSYNSGVECMKSITVKQVQQVVSEILF